MTAGVASEEAGPQPRPKPAKRRKLPGMLTWAVAATVVIGLTTAYATGWLPSLPALGSTKSPESPVTPVTPPIVPPPSNSSLREQQAEVARREAALAVREEQLREKEIQINALFAEAVTAKSTEESLRQVAAMYEAMPPHKAGPVLQLLDTQTAVEVLRRLDNDQAAAILSYIDPPRGAQLTARLAQPTAPAEP